MNAPTATGPISDIETKTMNEIGRFLSIIDLLENGGAKIPHLSRR